MKINFRASQTGGSAFSVASTVYYEPMSGVERTHSEAEEARSPRSPGQLFATAWKDFPRALREPQSIRKLSTKISLTIAVILAAASKETGGPVQLTIGLALYGTCGLLIMLNLGDAMAARARGEVDLLAVSMIVSCLMAISLPHAVSTITGISPENTTRMSAGMAVGITTCATALWIWVKLNRRFPGRVYWPSRWPNPWVRATTLAIMMIFEALALTPAVFGNVATSLFDWMLDV